ARVVIARAKNQNAPIALASDLEAFAGSRLLLEFMLQSLRTPSNQAFSAAQLKAKASRKLQRPLQAAIVQQMEDGSLPPSGGWIVINRTKKLFLLTDLHLGTQEPGTTALRSSVLSSIRSERTPAGDHISFGAPETDFAQAFERTFVELDRAAGTHNFVSLREL